MNWRGWLAAACCLSALLPVQAQPLVTVVESYHPENSWDHDYLQGIKSKLDGVAELEFLFLDTKRLPTDEHLEQAQRALASIQTQRPKVVILGDDAALALMGPKLGVMKVPTIFLGINADPASYFSKNQLPPTISGVLERPQYRASFSLVRELLPHGKRWLVLLDSDRSAEILRNDLLALNEKGVEVQMCRTFEQWKNAIKAAEGVYDAVLIGTYQALIDQDMAHVDARQVMQWTAGNSKLPLFGFWDFQIGRDAAAGGVVITGFEQGAIAGSMARAWLLVPNQVQAIRPSAAGRVMLSRAQAERWKLRVSPALRQRISWLP
ncbi:ABC transporter substrate-binding protein [Chitinibacter tainanensis]|uniref:ABC transporter substrate-binding protein n=1 Tax=Chitinibacter tainanensis TaxID=230667 RepID=UPI00040A259D|nr:hypothetical protein [Chitinibacter tainanensis]